MEGPCGHVHFEGLDGKGTCCVVDTENAFDDARNRRIKEDRWRGGVSIVLCVAVAVAVLCCVQIPTVGQLVALWVVGSRSIQQGSISCTDAGRHGDVDARCTVHDNGGDGVIRTALVVGHGKPDRVLAVGQIGVRREANHRFSRCAITKVPLVVRDDPFHRRGVTGIKRDHLALLDEGGVRLKGCTWVNRCVEGSGATG